MRCEIFTAVEFINITNIAKCQSRSSERMPNYSQYNNTNSKSHSISSIRSLTFQPMMWALWPLNAPCPPPPQLVSLYGAEAQRHLLRCLCSHVPPEPSGRTASARDNPPLQLLQERAASLVSRPSFVHLLCQLVDHPNFRQKVCHSSRVLRYRVAVTWTVAGRTSLQGGASVETGAHRGVTGATHIDLAGAPLSHLGVYELHPLDCRCLYDCRKSPLSFLSIQLYAYINSCLLPCSRHIELLTFQYKRSNFPLLNKLRQKFPSCVSSRRDRVSVPAAGSRGAAAARALAHPPAQQAAGGGVCHRAAALDRLGHQPAGRALHPAAAARAHQGLHRLRCGGWRGGSERGEESAEGEAGVVTWQREGARVARCVVCCGCLTRLSSQSRSADERLVCASPCDA